MKTINTLEDYLADEERVTPEELRKINFEVDLIGKMIEAREKKFDVSLWITTRHP